MKRNCRAIKQKNQKLEKELRKQNKKVGIMYIEDMAQSFHNYLQLFVIPFLTTFFAIPR